MPVPQTTAYCSVEQVYTLARALVNDMLVDQAGEILTDSAPFMFPLVNSAARYFERKMAEYGVKTFVKETVLTPITICNFPPLGAGADDPGRQVNVSDVGYFDGNIQHYPPQLPPDMIAPLFCWERQSGSTEPWLEMVEYPDGIPSQPQGPRLLCWEWRTELLVMPGATQSNDVKIRYTGETARFLTVNDSIMVRGAEDPIANYLAALVTNARNPLAAASFSAAGDDFTMQIINANVRARQRESVTRIGYGRLGRG